MAVDVDLKVMLEVGAHFGHQTRRWNPKMRPFIYTQRDGIHIIDLAQTAEQIKRAAKFVTDTVAVGNCILFVGTKKQARDIIREEATRSSQFYVVNRWLGGTLTNLKTIRASIDKLRNLYERKEKGEFEKITKREALSLERVIIKLESALGGIKDMPRIPGAVFLIDPIHEVIAKKEAMRLGIPVIAMIDTNGDPEGIAYPIVSNDDAIRSIQYFTKLIADAALEGLALREVIARQEADRAADRAKQTKGKGGAVREERFGAKGRAYTAEKPAQQTTELSPEELEAFAKAKVDEGAVS
ncbi:MAG: 30S ribosomal protein S2 [Deltaproteobacteria bacterium]|nr:30S ribosomal protein S2 [Deltaproteobacteria bacterium]